MVEEKLLEAALLQTADIITKHGTQYMPIFDRLSNELETVRRRRESLKRVMAVLEPPTIDLVPNGGV